MSLNRTNPDGGGGLDNLLNSDLKEYFECPICYNIPRRPPIFQCDSGHMICATCKPRVTICPQCRGQYRGQRLYFAERLLEKIPVPCKYSDEGCQVELLLSDITTHEGSCPYGEVECPNLEYGCKTREVRRKMGDHVKVCRFNLVDCPVENCKVRVPKIHTMNHLKSKHKVRQESMLDLASLNQVLLLLLVLSVAINGIFLL